MKKKVHPNSAKATTTNTTIVGTSSSSTKQETEALVLTVWKKSLLMSCSGFTVFDAIGNLVYRVDNYVAGNSNEILLMDESGNPIFTLRRKRLTIGDNWLVFEGETTVNPRFSAKKILSFRNVKCLAQVSTNEGYKNTVYEVEGAYGMRSCIIYDRNRKVVAEIKRKDAAARGADFGTDVFRLEVQQQGIESSVAMAVVILLDQMFEASCRRYSP